MTRVRFRHKECGEILESDLIICHPDEWQDAPERHQEEWSAGIVDLTGELDDLASVAGLACPGLLFALKRGHLCEGQPVALKPI